MNKNLENGIIKSLPQKWTKEQIDLLLTLKKQGLSKVEIANKMGRTEVSIAIKLKRLTKTNDTYNYSHRYDKYITNEKYLFIIQPKTVLDLYAGDSFYRRYDDILVTDNDKDESFDCVYAMDAFYLLCLLNLENKKFDIVDLDPYGSAIECFDLAIRLAKKGIVITLGEIGHKRWKRLDFVKRWYGIDTIENFTVNNIIIKLQERAICYKKEIVPVFIKEYRQIARVWFTLKEIKITEQWEKNEK